MPKDTLTITDNRTGKQYEVPIEHRRDSGGGAEDRSSSTTTIQAW